MTQNNFVLQKTENFFALTNPQFCHLVSSDSNDIHYPAKCQQTAFFNTVIIAVAYFHGPDGIPYAFISQR